MEDLFRLLPKLLENFEDSDEVREAVVFATWKKAAGKSLASHTTPLELIGKRLLIGVRDITWKRHLESLAGQMIFKLNSILGRSEVTFMEFKIDESLAEINSGQIDGPRTSSIQDEKIAFDEVSDSLELAAKSIADEDLRRAFLLAAGSCLVRKRNMNGIQNGK